MHGDIIQNMTTWCNKGCRLIAEEMGCFLFKENHTANEMYDIMDASPDFTKDTGERAVEHAKKGGLAIAAKKYRGHGHVAVVFPGPMVYSGSWKKSIPLIANIGKSNGVMAASLAFSVSEGEPTYFLWNVGKV